MALLPPSVLSTPVTVMVIEHAPSALPNATVWFPSHGGPMQLHTQIPVTQQQHCQSHYKTVTPQAGTAHLDENVSHTAPLYFPLKLVSINQSTKLHLYVYHCMSSFSKFRVTVCP